MTFSFRKLAAALVAVAALTAGGATNAQAGILLVLQDGNGKLVLRQFLQGNILAYTAADPTGGYTAISGLITTNFPGSAGVGTVKNDLNVTTAATGPITLLTATAFIANSANQNDLATFTSPTGAVILNNDLTANGGNTGTAFLHGIALGVGGGATTADQLISTPISGTSEVIGNAPFNAPSGYNLINATAVSGLNNGAVLVSITGTTSVSVAGGVSVPEPGTMAAALTGLVFVGGGLLRRRKK